MKFFTNPTGLLLGLKYIVINPVTENLHLRYIRKNKNFIREILIDTGVDYLFNIYNLKDYPHWWINKYLLLIRRVVNIVKNNNIKIFTVIPDIPTDYPTRTSLYPWSIKKTTEYIEYFLEKIIPNTNETIWIAPVQGKKDDIHSILKTYMDNYELYKHFEYVAIAPTCTTKRYRLLAELIIRFDIMIRTHNPRQKYHVFGPGIRTISMIVNKVKNMYSFDSTAYYYYNSKKAVAGHERTKALLQYCIKLHKLGIDVTCYQTSLLLYRGAPKNELG